MDPYRAQQPCYTFDDSMVYYSPPWRVSVDNELCDVILHSLDFLQKTKDGQVFTASGIFVPVKKP